jgi:hypothetical protein
MPLLPGVISAAGGELGTEGNPATSAVQLLNAGKTTSGLYYITLPTVGATQVYCDQTTQGGGWMLAMKLDGTLGTGTVRHYFVPTWWNDATGYGNAPSNPRANGELKTAVYGYYPHSEIMLEYGYGASYFANTAIARYTQPGAGNATNQNNTTLASKMQQIHGGGGFTFSGFTTQQYRWTKAASTDNTFFPNAYLHLSFASHQASSGASLGNDFFRFWFNNVSDLSVDAPACNQIGGFGMMGDLSPTTGSPQTETHAYTAGNASATISPPAAATTTTCQWNNIKAVAGNSGQDYTITPTYEISTTYYNNPVALIWVR